MIDLELTKHNFQIIKFNQLDKNYTFEIKLDNYSYVTGDVITIEWNINNNVTIQSDYIERTDNILTVTLQREVTLEAGTGYFNVVVTNSTDDSRKATFKSEFEIVANSVKEGSVSTPLIVTAIEQLAESITRAEELIQQIAASNDIVEEVKNARGSCTTLNDRLNGIDSRLGDKAKKQDLIDTNIKLDQRIIIVDKALEEKVGRADLNATNERISDIVANNGNGTKDVEIVDARKGETTLRKKIDKMDAETLSNTTTINTINRKMLDTSWRVKDIVDTTFLYKEDTINIVGKNTNYAREILEFEINEVALYTVKIGTVKGNKNNQVASIRAKNLSGSTVIEKQIYIAGTDGTIQTTQECVKLEVVLIASLGETLQDNEVCTFKDIEVYKRGKKETKLKNEIKLSENIDFKTLKDKQNSDILHENNKLKLCEGGYSFIDGNYVHGAISTTDGSIINTYKNRVSILTYLKFAQDIEIVKTNDFSYILATYSSNYTMLSREIIKVNHYTVPKNTIFRITIMRTSEIEEVANINEFSTQVCIKNNIAQNISNLEKKCYSSENTYKRRPLITIIDDDGYIEVYNHLRHIMTGYNIPICVAYPAGDRVETNPKFMNYTQLKEIVDLGGELLGHGMNPLTSLSLDVARKNVSETFRILRNEGFSVSGYCYPYGESNEAIREMLQEYCTHSFNTSDTTGHIHYNYGVIPNYYITRCNLGGFYDTPTGKYINYDTTSLDYFKALIDDTIANNGWLVFMTHAEVMVDGKKRPEYAHIDQFDLVRQVIQYAQSKKVPIVKASEGFKVFGSIQFGDYLGYWNENGSAFDKQGKFVLPEKNRFTF